MATSTLHLEESVQLLATNSEPKRQPFGVTVECLRRFRVKECVNYVGVNDENQSDVSICVCGEEQRHHKYLSGRERDDADWNALLCSSEIPSNAFGNVQFSFEDQLLDEENDTKPKAKSYLRLLHDTSASQVFQLRRLQSICAAELVVSVIDYPNQFTAESSNDDLARAVIETLSKTNGWLVTTGLITEISITFGSAMEDQFYITGNNINCIATAPWRAVRNRTQLLNTDTENFNEAEYVVFQNDPQSLNSYLSNFLLVDDGFDDPETKTEEFRKRLELELPGLVALFLSGEITHLGYLVELLNSGKHVVVCKGTSALSNILSEVITDYDILLEQNGLFTVKQIIGDKLLKENMVAESQKESTVDKIIQLCEERHLIKVYDPESDVELKRILLSCLLERKKSNLNSHLELYHFYRGLITTWSHAESFETVFDDKGALATMEKSMLLRLFLESLITDNEVFARFFLGKGLSIEDNLRVSHLLGVYMSTVTQDTHLWRLLKFKEYKSTMEGNEYLIEINKLLQRFCCPFRHRMSDKSVSLFEAARHDALDQISLQQPYLQLFLWAVLLNRQELAVMLWECCDQDPLAVALMGALVCRKISTSLDSSQLRVEYKLFADTLETLAVGLVDKIYSENQHNGLLVVQKPIEQFCNLDSMELAARAQAKDFLSTGCCENAIFDEWKAGYVASDVSVVFCVLTLIPTFFSKFITFIHSGEFSQPVKTRTRVYHRLYRDATTGHIPMSMYYSKWSYNLAELFDKVRTFHHAPCTKFVSETLVASAPLDHCKTWYDWFKQDVFMRVHVITSFLAIVGFAMRMRAILHPSLFPPTRLILVINLILSTTRLIRVHLANRYFGPRILNMQKMVGHIGAFLVVAAEFLVSYGVAYLALVKTKERQFHIGIFWDLYINGIFELLGHPRDETMKGSVPGCINGTSSGDCFWRTYPIPIFLSLYLFFGNVLLINMLIAVFANVFGKIQKTTHQDWLFRMYLLVKECKLKAPLPFILLPVFHIYWFFTTLVELKKAFSGKTKMKNYIVVAGQKMKPRDMKKLEVVERVKHRSFVVKQRQTPEKHCKSCSCTCD